MSDPVQNNMEYVRLGKSGLKISKIVLGCMSFGTKEWAQWVLEGDEALAQIKAGYDLGINAFDTANTYSNGESEILLGKAIKKYNLPRDEIVVMTKVYMTVSRVPGEIPSLLPVDQLEKQRYTNQHGLSRKHIFESVKHSLERLQLDYIDLLQCHRFDYNTPIEETMQALHDVVKAGYVRYIGMSSCYAWQFYKMQSYAIQHNLTPFISMQNLYNPIYREEEREMMPMLKDLGVGVIPWSPLAAGRLTRPSSVQEKTVRESVDVFTPYQVNVPYFEEVNKRIEAIAKAHNTSMGQVCLAWALSKDFITAPIVGTSSVDRLKDACDAVHLKLTEDEIKSIDEPYQPRAIYGFQ